MQAEAREPASQAAAFSSDCRTGTTSFECVTQPKMPPLLLDHPQGRILKVSEVRANTVVEHDALKAAIVRLAELAAHHHTAHGPLIADATSQTATGQLDGWGIRPVRTVPLAGKDNKKAGCARSLRPYSR